MGITHFVRAFRDWQRVGCLRVDFSEHLWKSPSGNLVIVVTCNVRNRSLEHTLPLARGAFAACVVRSRGAKIALFTVVNARTQYMYM